MLIAFYQQKVSKNETVEEIVLSGNGIHAFFIRNTFICNVRLKLAKNQASAKQHPQAVNFCYLKIIHIFHPCYHPKIIRYILKSKQKNKCVGIHEIIRLIIMKMKVKMKNKSHRYDINTPRYRHGHKYNKYRKCLIMAMLICINQHLSNI